MLYRSNVTQSLATVNVSRAISRKVTIVVVLVGLVTYLLTYLLTYLTSKALSPKSARPRTKLQL